MLHVNDISHPSAKRIIANSEFRVTCSDPSPDAFMFQQFRRHSGILRTPERHNYFMLSGGANLFPTAAIWKDLIRLEIESDLAYTWYTAQAGFPTLQHAVLMWENFLASRGHFPFEMPLGLATCITLGASQAAAAVFDYCAQTSSPRVLLLGLNYALFDRLARHHKYEVLEILGEDEGLVSVLPSATRVVEVIKQHRPSLVILSVPNNPSGECYTDSDLCSILCAVRSANSLIMLDQVGQLPLAQDALVNVEELIVKTDAQANIAIVNSFSKSDSVPGFRFGYLVGSHPLTEYVANYQLRSTMNPPTFPILAGLFSLVARCVGVGERLEWTQKADRRRLLSFTRHMFNLTTAIAPLEVRTDVKRRFSPEHFEYYFEAYRSHQERIGQAIARNAHYAYSALACHLSQISHLSGGFNGLVRFDCLTGSDEDSFCKELFSKTGVAVLTESCFRTSPRKQENYWMRLSFAAPEKQFGKAIDQLALFLSNR